MTDVTLRKPQVFGIPLPARLTPYTLRFIAVLTGVVIGGGADGIHKPVQAFTDYMEKISKAAKANP